MAEPENGGENPVAWVYTVHGDLRRELERLDEGA